jgi:hypothetical protein
LSNLPTGRYQARLAEQHALLLPVPYFLVTFTLPSELCAIARAHPETIYPLLFRTSAAALQQLAQDPRFLGGQMGMLGVLQTWTRDALPSPHPLSRTGVSLGTRWHALVSREQRFSASRQTAW